MYILLPHQDKYFTIFTNIVLVKVKLDSCLAKNEFIFLKKTV